MGGPPRSLDEAKEGGRRNGLRGGGTGGAGAGAGAAKSFLSAPPARGEREQSLSGQPQAARAASREPPAARRPALTHLNAVVSDHPSDELVETGGPDGHKRSLHRARSRFGIAGAEVTSGGSGQCLRGKRRGGGGEGGSFMAARSPWARVPERRKFRLPRAFPPSPPQPIRTLQAKSLRAVRVPAWLAMLYTLCR